jgi:thioredoxin 1
MDKMLMELKGEYAFALVDYNIEDNDEMVTAYDVRSIPTLLIFKNGELLTRVNGLVAKDKLVDLLNI